MGLPRGSSTFSEHVSSSSALQGAHQHSALQPTPLPWRKGSPARGLGSAPSPGCGHNGVAGDLRAPRSARGSAVPTCIL